MATQLLYLITPVIDDADGFAPILREICADGAVSAVLLRMAAADERTLVKRVKTLAPAAQEGGAALVLALAHEEAARGDEVDLSTVAARGGADGVHVETVAQARAMRERLKRERIVGIGQLRSRNDCMEAGEAEVDYLLFGEPRRDGSVPALESVEERAAWWAEIFETPCVVYVPTLETLPELARTGAEFVAVGDVVFSHPQGPVAGMAQVREALASARGGES